MAEVRDLQALDELRDRAASGSELADRHVRVCNSTGSTRTKSPARPFHATTNGRSLPGKSDGSWHSMARSIPRASKIIYFTTDMPRFTRR